LCEEYVLLTREEKEWEKHSNVSKEEEARKEGGEAVLTKRE